MDTWVRLDMVPEPNDCGWVEVIYGCMFSGKSEELIRRMRRVELAKRPYLLFKPSLDDRYSATEVCSHSGYKMEATVISAENPMDIFYRWQDAGSPPVIGIDEAQFFGELFPITETLANAGVRVIVAGLDLDAFGEPFLDSKLAAMAESVTKLTAICVVCGTAASRTERVPKESDEPHRQYVPASEGRILIGGGDVYEARCRTHFSGQRGELIPRGLRKLKVDLG